MARPLPLISLRTESLFGECAITDAVIALATAGIEQRGAIFTRREVVEFILNLTGYTTDRRARRYRLRTFRGILVASGAPRFDG